MKSCPLILPLIVLIVLCSYSASSYGQTVLFQDEMTDPNAWGINKGGDSDSSATFNYDYSLDGIPEAPNTLSGDSATRGVKLEANNGDFFEVPAFFTIYPLGQNFTGNYVLEFDMWMNYSTVDREDNGGAGTTEFLGGGIGYDGVTADIASGAQAIVTGEGGSGSDYRAFKSPPQFFIDAADMVGGSRNATDSHYASFFPQGSGAPPVSQGQSPSDPNTNFNRPGSPGFQWVSWRISVVGDTVLSELVKPNGEDLDIVVYDKTDTSDGSSGVTTDGNISIFYADFFSSLTVNPSLTFGIVDNVVVSEALAGDFNFDGSVDGLDFLLYQQGGSPNPLDPADLALWDTNYGNTALVATTSVPEPASAVLLVFQMAALCSVRRRNRS